MRPHITFFTLCRLQIGGIERWLQQVVGGLSGHYRFRLIAPSTSAFDEELRHVNSEVELEQVPRYGKFDPRGRRTLRRLLAEGETTVVHTLDPRSLLIGLPVARRLGLPHVHTFHMTALSYGARGAKGWVYERIERKLCSLSDALVFVSRADQQLYREKQLLPSDNHRVIQNAVDLGSVDVVQNAEARRQLEERWGVPPGHLTFVTLGRYNHQKGLDILVEAVALLRQRLVSEGEEVPQFVLMGGGELHETLQAQIDRADLSDTVRLVGSGTKEEARNLVLAGDAYVLPSRYECFPLSLLEAVAAGLPVVATDVGGNAEIVAHETNGFVVPAEEPKALMEAMARLTLDEVLRNRFGEASMKRSRLFSPEAMLKQTSAVYEQIVVSAA